MCENESIQYLTSGMFRIAGSIQDVTWYTPPVQCPDRGLVLRHATYVDVIHCMGFNFARFIFCRFIFSQISHSQMYPLMSNYLWTTHLQVAVDLQKPQTFNPAESKVHTVNFSCFPCIPAYCVAGWKLELLS